MSALLCLAAAAVSFYVIVYYGVFRGAGCPAAARLKGKTAIVTGKRSRRQPLLTWSLPVAVM